LACCPAPARRSRRFSSYIVEKKFAADPSRFGRGAIEGVAGPESANNADAQCKFIPMLTLGLPASGVMALMLGALTIQGIQPGPEVMTRRPELFWGLIASMWIGNLMLVVLNLPLIGVWVKLLTVPYRLLFPAIMAFSAIGIYSVNNSSFEIYLTALFGVLGFVWTKLGFPGAAAAARLRARPDDGRAPAPRHADGEGRPTVFVTRRFSLAFIVITAIMRGVMVRLHEEAAWRITGSPFAISMARRRCSSIMGRARSRAAAGGAGNRASSIRNRVRRTAPSDRSRRRSC